MNDLQQKQWNFYLDKLANLGCKNVMSKDQFIKAVDNKEEPFLNVLKNSGYRYGDIK